MNLQRNYRGALALWWLASSLSAASLGTPLGSEVSITLDATDRDQRQWLIIGPLKGAGAVKLQLEGHGFRKQVDLPVVAGVNTVWSWPLEPGALRISLTGAWVPTSRVMHLAGSPARRQLDWLLISRVSGSERWGYRFEFPEWTLPEGYSPRLELNLASRAGWQVEVDDGNQSRHFTGSAGVERWAYSPVAWGVNPRLVTVMPQDAGDESFKVGLHPAGVAPKLPLPVDVATLLAWPVSAWRNPSHEWFQWSANNVLILVTRSYAVQDDYFKRLAYFVEKTGTRGTLVSDANLSGKHGWNAHDYDATDLARFFTLASQKGFPLNPRERELRGRLADSGMLKATASGVWQATVGAVLGISMESPPPLRGFLFTHEGFHGLYFTDQEFRRGVRDLWNQLSRSTQQAFIAFLAASQYDPADLPLMINEFQSYLLQQVRSEWPAYLSGRVLDKATLTPAQKASALAELLAAAQALEKIVHERFGVISGDLRTVWPSD